LCGACAAAALALASSVLTAAGITVTFPASLAAGPDYATDVLGDPWDMCNPEDISPFPQELTGFSSFGFSASPCKVGGTINTNDASVVFLYRGIYNIVNPGRTGRSFPIDPTKYQILSYKLETSFAGDLPQLYWFHNPYQHPAGDGMGFRYPAYPHDLTINGKQIVAADLTQNLAGGAAWSNGPVAGLRLDPNSSSTSGTAYFHWVRLTPASGAVQPIQWDVAGTVTITVTDNSDNTTMGICGGPSPELSCGSSKSFNWNYGILAPGNYTLKVSANQSVFGTAVFKINHPPTIQVTDPSYTTGEDYATKVLGNPWDMNDPADIQITTYDHHTTPVFSGGIATATNTTDDPNVNLLNGANDAVPIDTSKYRYLTYRFQLDAPFSLALGSAARIFYGSQPPELANPTGTMDILVWPGMNSYTIDLATLTAAPDGGLIPPNASVPSPELWTAGVKRHLRFDPSEFAAPTTFHIDDVKLTAKPVAAGSYTIRFAGGDADGDPTTVSLYYDTDKDPANGKTLIAAGIAIGAGQFRWNTRGIPQGEYYIYAEATDGLNTQGQYSTVPIQVVPGSAPAASPGDFDGDKKSDITIYRPSSGTWYILTSGSSFSSALGYAWGASTDIPVPGDYDGDGRIDIAVYRPSDGHWFILKSTTNYASSITYQWGIPGDIPVPGDYDGDGVTDLAIYRPSSGTWFILTSSSNYTSGADYAWGASTDVPVPGDFDGDGRTDIAIYRPSSGHWFILKSSTNFASNVVYQWGTPGDIPVGADYDGDGKVDLAIYRPSAGTWYILLSTSNYASGVGYAWGASTDVPVPGDFDGDGRADIAVFRPSSGHWFILKSSTNYAAAVVYQWGVPNDIPILRRQ
jgi:hypothetical protein